MFHVSLWDFLWAQSFIPVSGSCWPSFGLWLLLKCAPGPYCHPKVNWLLSAGHLLISAALLDVTLPAVRVLHDTTTASTSQEGSSKTECRVSPRQGELWLQTCFAGLFPLAAPSGREGQRGNKPDGSLWFSPRSEVSPDGYLLARVLERQHCCSHRVLGYTMLSCVGFALCASPEGCQRRKQTSRSRIAPAPRHSGIRAAEHTPC